MTTDRSFQCRRILIFGAGVIGSVYAGKLALAGHYVSVVARNNRLKELEQNGLLLSIHGTSPIKANVTIIAALKDDDVYDYVFVTLRKDQLQEAFSVLSKNQFKNFVFMVNTPNGYADWIKQMGQDRIIPAFPGAGGKIDNGIVCYSLTSALVQPTTLGEIDGKVTVRINELASIFKHSGFPTSVSKNMDSWQKYHVAMVCCLAYGIYFDGGNNYTFSKNKKAIIQMNKALKETFSFLKYSKIGIEPPKLNIFRIVPLFLFNCCMPFVFNTKWAETVISNHALAGRAEMEMLYNDFLALASEKSYDLHELKKLGKTN